MPADCSTQPRSTPVEMLTRKHTHDIHCRYWNPKTPLQHALQQRLATMLAVSHPKPVFTDTPTTSLRRSSRRSRILRPRHFDTHPLRIAALSRHAIHPRIADILQRHPLPLECIRRRRIGESGRFVRPSVRTGTHGVAGAAGHADAAIGIALGVDEVAWAVEAGGAAICWPYEALRWRDGRCVAFFTFDGDAAVVVEAGCALVFGHGGLDIWIEGDVADGGGRVRVLYLLGSSRRDKAYRRWDSRIGDGICGSCIA